MDSSLILIIVLTFAFAATRIEERFFGERTTLLASLEYLIIGVLVGPVVLGLLDEERLTSLEPLLAVVTGFAGFLIGLPLSARTLQSRPKGAFRFALVTGIATVALMFVAGWFGLDLIAALPLERLPVIDRTTATATLAIGAAIAAIETVRASVRRHRAAGPLSRLVPATAQTMSVLAVLAFGVVLASYRSDVPAGLPQWLWYCVDICSGIAYGLIFHVFVGNERDHKKLFVATIGVVALASGTAHALHFSPLFVNLVAGMTIANVSKATPWLLEADLRLRRPVFVVLLLLAGASWQPIPPMLWLVPAAFVVARAFALRVGARLALITVAGDIDSSTPRVGNAFLSQGALVAAVAVNFRMVGPQGGSPEAVLADVVLTTLLVSAVVNELWAGHALRRALVDAGELASVAPADADAPDDDTLHPSTDHAAVTEAHP